MALQQMWAHPVGGVSAWRPATLGDERSYTERLGPEQLAEIDEAVRSVRSGGTRAEDLRDVADFPLPLLARSLERIQGELEEGLGFFVVRGLPVDRYDFEAQKVLVMGLLLHLGTPMHQDTKGTLIESVTDRGSSYDDPGVRGYMTSAELTPHCDSGDVVGLLCVRKARQGGATRICSGTSIFDELAERTPELLEPLFRGFRHNIRGNGPPGAEDVTRHRVPVFSYRDRRLSVRYNQKAMLTAEQLPGVEPLSDLERRAIERVAELALRPDLCLETTLEPGDLQLLDNHVILHTRTAFQDHPDPRNRRLMLRVWVNMPNSRALDDAFADHFNTGPRQPPALRA